MAKIAANGNWLDVDPKAMAFASVLEARRKKGQPDGAFYFAVGLIEEGERGGPIEAGDLGDDAE